MEPFPNPLPLFPALPPPVTLFPILPILAHAQWIRQDALILSAIMSTLTEPIVAQIASQHTSYDAWHALEQTFASQSKARVVHLRSQLSNIRKGSQTTTNYFYSVKKITDELAIVGQTLLCDDVITYVLTGLGHDFDSLVTTKITFAPRGRGSFRGRGHGNYHGGSSTGNSTFYHIGRG
ncbi:hypothetical protein F0562_022206 [Nyssa sinensis]|uniref:Retrotransposon gag domain-containing protein n=1 Tax=Nyssa sinensis TaxID=561372 RepID=A0A5J5BN30_9ASTE|nr:hypothetical protein F0562_022206 [Nyssa sinensis]